MPTTFSNRGVNASGLISGGATNPVNSVLALNFNPSMRYLQLFDQANAPSAGDVPRHSFPVPGARQSTPGVGCFDAAYFTSTPQTFANGIAWGFSTTYANFQTGVAADGSIEMVWG